MEAFTFVYQMNKQPETSHLTQCELLMSKMGSDPLIDDISAWKDIFPKYWDQIHLIT